MAPKKESAPILTDADQTKALLDSANAAAAKAGKSHVHFALADMQMDKKERDTSLTKSILNILNGGRDDSIERLAFEEDPSSNNTYASLYRVKHHLIPDRLLKRIAIQDDLVAAVIHARSHQVGAFGREQDDRFSTGLKIEPRKGVTEDMSDKQKEELQSRIDQAVKLLLTCGATQGWKDRERMSLTEFLRMTTRDGLIVGRFAVEIIHVMDPDTGKKRFHSFRPVDGSTVYRASPQTQAAQTVRDEARHLLESLKNKKLEPERYKNDEYAWVQVLDGKPVQAFTPEELFVCNLYPVTDVDLDGYPLTPIDTIIAAVTTHINITSHNKLYFQSGRAARGMLVIKSNDVDQRILNNIRHQFNASINSVNNAWRMPVFGVGPEDDVTWAAIDQGARDAEFQYLSDQNARVILSAFQMSPEELPGYAHLSRGTNNQALSESNNEYKLEAARDVGIRPLLSQFQDFLNDCILPLIDPYVSKLCVLKLVGLDADTPEKESTRLQQDGALHMTYSEILESVEKDPLPKEVGGDFPLNPAIQTVLQNYLTFGEILEHFFGKKDAAKDPTLQFYQNEMWFQWQQLQMQMQQMQQQAAMGGAPGGGGGGSPPPGGGSGGPPEASGGGGGGAQGPAPEGSIKPGEESGPPQDDKSGSAEKSSSGPIESGVDQAIAGMGKSEGQLSANKRRLLGQQLALVDDVMEGFEQDSKEFLAKLETELEEVRAASRKKRK